MRRDQLEHAIRTAYPNLTLVSEDGVHCGGARADDGLELVTVDLMGDDRGAVA